MTEQTEREAFESIYEDGSWEMIEYEAMKREFLRGWQAARAQQPIAQEPQELTFEMIEDSFPEKVCEGIALPGISAAWLHEFARAIWALKSVAQQPEAVPVAVDAAIAQSKES